MKKYYIMILSILVLIFFFQIYVIASNNTDIKVYKKYVPDFENNYFTNAGNLEIISELYQYIPAKVVNTNGFIKNIFLINKGYKEGITDGSFVVNEDGLIGQIIKSFKHYSVVRFVLSSNTKIAIEANGCYGTIYSDGTNLIVNDVINCDDIKISDPVFTSKYNYSSSNILVGYVKKIHSDKIYIKPAINKYKIFYVGVINDSK